MSGEIYIGSILLEPNRWARPASGRVPSLRVSEWVGRFGEDGFDGVELWENHALPADEAERAALADSSLPIAVFNSYCELTDAGADRRRDCTALAGRLGASGIKFNVGHEQARWAEYQTNVQAWVAEAPGDVTLLCECHPGTVIESPPAARRFFDALDPAGWEIIVHPFSRFDSLGEWFELFGAKVAHAHLQMPGSGSARVRFERNATLAREAVAIMRAHGYAGSYTLEFTEGMGEGEDIEQMYENALADLRFLRELLG